MEDRPQLSWGVRWLSCPARAAHLSMVSKPRNQAEYLAGLPPDRRATLERLLATIQAAVPEATPGFSYGMPAFLLDGRAFLWCAAWRRHFSLYPISAAFVAEHAPAAARYVAEKSTLQLPVRGKSPYDLVARLAQACATASGQRR